MPQVETRQKKQDPGHNIKTEAETLSPSKYRSIRTLRSQGLLPRDINYMSRAATMVVPTE